jgi:hypothetical protein
MNLGNRPSAVVTGGGSDNVASEAMARVADVLGTAADVASNAELRERERLAKIWAEKQKIVDTLDAGVRTGDFEEAARGLSESFKEQYADNPLDAAENFRKEAQTLAKTHVDGGTNPAVKLELAQATQTRITMMTRDLHDWASAKQTQNAKGNMALLANSTINGAAAYSSAGELSAGIQAAEVKLAPFLQVAYGAKADEEWGRITSGMAKMYADNAAAKNPLLLAEELDKSPLLKKHLAPNDYAAAKDAAVSGYNGLRDRMLYDQARAAFQNGEELARLVGSEEFPTVALKRENALIERRKNIAIGAGEGAKLKEGDRKSAIAKIDAELGRIKALKAIAYKQADVTATDDPVLLDELTRYQDELFGKKAKRSAKENLDLLVAQQDRLIAARDAKRITYGKFQTLFDDVSTAYKAAEKRESGDTGFLWWQNARQAGNDELNRQFDDRFAGLSADIKSQVRVAYIRRLQDLQRRKGEGAEITEAEGVQAALQALSLESGRNIPGAFK